MASPTLDIDVLCEIALASDPHTHCQLLRLSFSTYPRIRALLYQHISVGDQAGALVRTLANKSCLPPMVRTLIFRSSVCAYIADAEWALLLPAMVNLRRLVIANHVPLERRVLPSITFRLRSFMSSGVVVGAWAEFLQLQPDLEEIAFHGDLFGPAPGPAHLPMLRSVTGRPEDVARFARYHQLDDVWVRSGSPWGYRTFKTIDLRRFSLSPSRLLTLRIMAPHLLLLMRGAPAGLATILHLTLDEDNGWCRFGPESTIFKVVRELRDHTPVLRSLVLVCSPDTPRMNTHPSILVGQGPAFSSALSALSRPPTLRTFHFCGVEACATWRNWGQTDEEFDHADLEEHGPWDLDPQYADIAAKYAY
ncbi:hypothetical protein FB451DRAFT_1409484 [Mycena latifolia]|nr:hypothetical protein FB451DRAFT_1409484 [Mycena latifolia]